MKKVFRLSVVGVVLATSMIVTSCASEVLESTANGTSHNAGKNCLACHTVGEKILYIGGTATPGLTLTFVSGGKTVGTLITDRSGNFYSNDPKYESGTVYASASSGNAMVQGINLPSGCNRSGCHDGGTQPAIY